MTESPSPSLRLQAWIASWAAGLIAFIVYFSTLAPVVGQGHDTGELTVCAISLGIPHPPGYPLYCRLGHVFNALIPFGLPAWRMNLFSAFCTSLGVVFLARTLARFTNRWAVGFSAGLLFAFTRTVWRQSVVAEVFGLHWLLLSVLLYLTGKWGEADDRRRSQIIAIGAFVVGLCLAHHHTILLAMPGFFLYAAFKQERGRAWGLTYYVVILFMLGFIPLYTDMMFRAQGHPYVNWGDPHTPETVRDHFLRRAYGTLKLSGSDGENGSGISHAVAYYVSLTRMQYPLPLGFLILVGMFALRRRKLQAPCALFVGWFIIQGPLFAMYAQQPAQDFFIDMQERFYAASYLGGAGLIGLAMALGYEALKPRWRALYVTALVLLPASTCIYNWDWCTQKNCNYAYETLKASYDLCAEGAIFVPDGDLACGASEYLSCVEKYRPDLTLVFPGVIGSPWGAQNFPDYLKEALARAGWDRNTHDEALEIVLRAQYDAGKQCMLGYFADSTKTPGQYRRRGLVIQWYPVEAILPSGDEEMKIQEKCLRQLLAFKHMGDYHIDAHQNFWEQFEIHIWVKAYHDIAEVTRERRPDLACLALEELDRNYETLSDIDLLNLGLMEKAQRHFTSAERYLKRALAAHPKFNLAIAGLADLCTETGRKKEAESWKARLNRTAR